MHHETVQWISELKFVKDEQQFLNNLVKHYTSELADAKYYEESKAIVGDILDAENEVDTLIKKVQVHENQLEIMVDDIDQPRMERAYKETHKELMLEMSSYLYTYRGLKKELFSLISRVIREDKQSRLLN